MKSYRGRSRNTGVSLRGLVWAWTSTACSVLVASSTCGAAERPPLSDACKVWDHHVQDLIDQHRRSDELSEAQFFEILQLFYAARTACTAGSFAEGVEIYSRIGVGRAQSRPLH